MNDEALREAILEAMAEGALGGHELGQFEDAETLSGGYQAVCKLCSRSVWVGDSGILYSLLDNTYPSETV